MAGVAERTRVLQQAIGGLHRALRFRAEYVEREESLDLFVDVGHLTRLSTPNWQLVWGRRGTGKTHLLRALQQSENQRAAETRQISLFFSLNEVTLSPPGISPGDKVLALGYFQRFFRSFVEKLVREAERLLSDRTFLARLTGPSRPKSQLALDQAVKLLEMVSYGDVVPAWAEFEVEQLHEEGEDRERAASAALSVAPHPTECRCVAFRGAGNAFTGCRASLRAF